MTEPYARGGAARLERAAAPASRPDDALEAVRRRLDDDLDAPSALVALDRLAAEGVSVAAGAVLSRRGPVELLGGV